MVHPKILTVNLQALWHHVLLIPVVMMTLRTKAPRTVTMLTNNFSILRLISLEINKDTSVI